VKQSHEDDVNVSVLSLSRRRDAELTTEQSRLTQVVKLYLEYVVEKQGDTAKKIISWLLQRYHTTLLRHGSTAQAKPSTGKEVMAGYMAALIANSCYLSASSKAKEQEEIISYYMSYIMSFIHISPKFANGMYLESIHSQNWRDISTYMTL
jgi:hypothetical protein